jgi:hypothetical protein
MLLLGFEVAAQAPEGNGADSLGKEPRAMRVGLRVSPSLNSFDYGDLSFGQMGSDRQIGVGMGVAMDWKVSEYFGYRLEPYLEFQRLVNSSVNPDIEATSSFRNIAFGVDAIPLVLTYGARVKGQISAGGFAKYLLSTSQETLLNGNAVNATWQTNNLQYGLVFGAGVYVGRRLAELRYGISLNDFVSNTEVPNSIRQVQLIFIF